MNTIALPFGKLLMFLYETFRNYGVAIILFALIVKLILLPFQMKSKRSMMQTSRLQPKLKALEKKYTGNKTKYNEEVAKMYKEEGINPASGCLWSFLPLPIMLALYYAIRQPLTTMMGVARDLLTETGAITTTLAENGFVGSASKAYLEIEQAKYISSNPKVFELVRGLSDKIRMMNFDFLGLDLSLTPQWNFLWSKVGEGDAAVSVWSQPASVWGPGLVLFLIPFISAILSFLSSRISTKMSPTSTADTPGGSSMQTMMFIMPLFSLYIAFVMPAALGVYWAIGSVLAIIQDVWLTKRYTRIIDAEEAERNKKREEIERKRVEAERRKAEQGVISNPNMSKRRIAKTERQEKAEKAAEWEKTHNPKPEPEKSEDPSRSGNRRFARGRAYVPERFEGEEVAPEDTDETDETGDEYDETDEVDTADYEYDESAEGDSDETDDGTYSDDESDETDDLDSGEDGDEGGANE
jgi:YidC/Oxa1 family membrane protein insertase